MLEVELPCANNCLCFHPGGGVVDISQVSGRTATQFAVDLSDTKNAFSRQRSTPKLGIVFFSVAVEPALPIPPISPGRRVVCIDLVKATIVPECEKATPEEVLVKCSFGKHSHRTKLSRKSFQPEFHHRWELATNGQEQHVRLEVVTKSKAQGILAEMSKKKR
eukprot:m.362835 g.362835  ORF g.362835 m.362835 type:complete len:163 (-) comp19963_c0_seq3:151-639(-)